MKSNWHKWFLMSIAAALVVSAGVTATRAQEADDEGRVIQIGPEGAKDPLPGEVDPRPRLRRPFQPWLLPGDPNEIMRQRRPASPYYIGVMAEKVSDQLRAHVDLPDGVGLAVLQVFDDSPAEEGGLKQHDILVAADGEDLRELDDLIRVVDKHSADGMTQFTLDVIRHGQPQTVWVTPSERPQSEQLLQPGFGEDVRPFGLDQQRLLDRMLQGGQFGGPGMLDHVQGNVSVRVEQQDDGPPRVTVQRDGETWEIEGDNPESLDKLPADLRPMVQGLLHGQQLQPPVMDDDFGRQMSGDLRKRMQEMEEQMQELRQKLLDDVDVNDP